MQVIKEQGAAPIKAWADTVMANQSDLVEVVAVLKQVLCVKG